MLLCVHILINFNSRIFSSFETDLQLPSTDNYGDELNHLVNH